MTKYPFAALCAGAATALLGTSGLAGTITPISYDMPNGGVGFYTYYDDTYDGTGDTDTTYATLTGGLGQLTDGVIATQSFNLVEGQATPYQDFEGPYVGWGLGVPGPVPGHPTITFNFDQVYDFTSATLWFDHIPSASLSVPSAVRVNGNVPSYQVPTPAGNGPVSFTLDLDTNGPNSLDVESDQITMTLFRQNTFVMLSEVTFEGSPATPIPLPASGLVLGAGLAALGALRKRRAAA